MGLSPALPCGCRLGQGRVCEWCQCPAAPAPNHGSIKTFLFVQAAEKCGQPRAGRHSAPGAAVPGVLVLPWNYRAQNQDLWLWEGLEEPWGLCSFKHCQILCWSCDTSP